MCVREWVCVRVCVLQRVAVYCTVPIRRQYCTSFRKRDFFLSTSGVARFSFIHLYMYERKLNWCNTYMTCQRSSKNWSVCLCHELVCVSRTHMCVTNSYVLHVFISRYDTWGMSSTRMSHVTSMIHNKQNPKKKKWTDAIHDLPKIKQKRTRESCPAYEWVMSHLWFKISKTWKLNKRNARKAKDWAKIIHANIWSWITSHLWKKNKKKEEKHEN